MTSVTTPHLEKHNALSFRAVVDRIEMLKRGGLIEGLVVLELPDASFIHLPLYLLPKGIKKNDVLNVAYSQTGNESACQVSILEGEWLEL